MNFFDVLPWWTWAIGTFGIVGLVALVLLAPALANAIFSLVLNRIGAALRTPVGAGLIVGSLALGVGYLWGGFAAERTCNAAIEQMKRAAREAADARDASVKQELERKYGPIVRDLQTQAEDREQKVSDYEKQLLAKPRAKCVLSPDTLRLRP